MMVLIKIRASRIARRVCRPAGQLPNLWPSCMEIPNTHFLAYMISYIIAGQVKLHI